MKKDDRYTHSYMVFLSEYVLPARASHVSFLFFGEYLVYNFEIVG